MSDETMIHVFRYRTTSETIVLAVLYMHVYMHMWVYVARTQRVRPIYQMFVETRSTATPLGISNTQERYEILKKRSASGTRGGPLTCHDERFHSQLCTAVAGLSDGF